MQVVRCDTCATRVRSLYAYVVCPQWHCSGMLIPVEDEDCEIDVPVPPRGDTIEEPNFWQGYSTHERSVQKMNRNNHRAGEPIPAAWDFQDWERELLDPHSGYDALLDAWQERRNR